MSDDYSWFTDDYALGLNFCLTFVRGVEPDEVIRRLDGKDPVELTGASRLPDAADLVPPAPEVEFGDGVFDADALRDLSLVAVTPAGGWTMLVEPNGFLATQEEVVDALSRGAETVTLYASEHTDPRFLWVRDGRVLVDFNPWAPDHREGTDPDCLNGDLERVGFDLTPRPDDADDDLDGLWQERSLALMDHLTGVRLTPAFLTTAVFRCAAVPDRGDDEAADVRAGLAEYAATEPEPEPELF